MYISLNVSLHNRDFASRISLIPNGKIPSRDFVTVHRREKSIDLGFLFTAVRVIRLLVACSSWSGLNVRRSLQNARSCKRVDAFRRKPKVATRVVDFFSPPVETRNVACRSAAPPPLHASERNACVSGIKNRRNAALLAPVAECKWN